MKKLCSIRVLVGCAILLLMSAIVGCHSVKKVPADVDKPIELSQEISDLRNTIAKANYIGTEQVGRKPGMDQSFANRLKLNRIATDEELLTLSGDTSAVVALTAFEGLYKRENKVVPVIFKGYIGRSDIIQYLKGDIARRLPMLEYAYVYVMHYKIPDEDFPSEVEAGEPKFTLTEDEKEKVLLKIAELRPLNSNPKY